MDKDNVASTNNGILFIFGKEGDPSICCNVDELGGHYRIIINHLEEILMCSQVWEPIEEEVVRIDILLRVILKLECASESCWEVFLKHR